MVVAGRVEALPLGRQLRGVEVRVEDALLVVEGPGEVGAVRREDRRAAAAQEISAGKLSGSFK